MLNSSMKPESRPVSEFPAGCTIISKNYLSFARIVAESYRQYHPSARFYILVIDGLPDQAEAGPGIHLINREELELPYFDELLFKYDVTELCTAVKPTLLNLLFSKYQEPRLLYFDPDILVCRCLEELFAAMKLADIVLTPHLLDPIPLDGCQPSEIDILRAGAYNLGFIGLSDSDDTRRFLRWWETRLRDGCFVNTSEGLMTDQKWIDLIPGMFSTAILRDSTYNVAYWNIHSRVLEETGGAFRVDGRPLAFFHFSGFNPSKPDVFSKHQDRTTIRQGSALANILDLYVSLHRRHDEGKTYSWKYGYGEFDDGTPIHGLLRRIYADMDTAERTRFGNPFRASGTDSFLSWAIRPNRPRSRLSPVLRRIYSLRPDVAAAFPNVEKADFDAYLQWAVLSGATEYNYDPDVLIPASSFPRGSASKRRPSNAGQIKNTGPRCSVIIPVHNKAALTKTCLDQLFLSDVTTIDCEVIVVDDSSTDSTGVLLEKYGGRIRVVKHERNTGFARACNDGAAVAQGEFLVFLNNDTRPQTGWLDALVRYADTHPEAGILGSKLLFPNDTIQHAGFVICGDGEPRHVYTGFPADHPAVNRSRKMCAVTGACLLIRTDEFHQLGGFDVAFCNGFEDVDLCLRVQELGREVHYCHESVIYHLESVSRDESKSRHEKRNLKVFRERWAGRVPVDEIKTYLEDGLLKFEYYPLYPLELKISPLLATIKHHEEDLRLDRLLSLRSRQMFDLLKDNIRLNVSVQEADFQQSSAQPGKGSSASITATPAVKGMSRGTIQWLSSKSTARIVSVIIPIKNGASKLPSLLEAIRSQNTRDQVEIIAVDSGSSDDSADLLRAANATVISIDPKSFNHGTTRNLATRYAHGEIYVFMNQNTLPANADWLRNLVEPLRKDAKLAGVCGRILPRADADYLTARDIERNINASQERLLSEISDPEAYRRLPVEALRKLVNFHTLSAAIRRDVFHAIPFRQADFAEDLIWGKEALEAGYRIQFEPSSLAYHSHNYSALDILRRNVDDAAACRKIVGRTLAEEDVLGSIRHLVRDDWRYLETCSLSSAELAEWNAESAIRRTAQVLGQWIGFQTSQDNRDLTKALSLTERIKSGAPPETAGKGQAAHAGSPR